MKNKAKTIYNNMQMVSELGIIFLSHIAKALFLSLLYLLFPAALQSTNW